MPSNYCCSAPGLVKNNETKEVQVSHNHYKAIKYNTYLYKENLQQEIDHMKVSLKGCITFFKTMAESKEVDIEVRAAAASALAEDEARLADIEAHRPKSSSSCVIL